MSNNSSPKKIKSPLSDPPALKKKKENLDPLYQIFMTIQASKAWTTIPEPIGEENKKISVNRNELLRFDDQHVEFNFLKLEELAEQKFSEILDLARKRSTSITPNPTFQKYGYAIDFCDIGEETGMVQNNQDSERYESRWIYENPDVANAIKLKLEKNRKEMDDMDVWPYVILVDLKGFTKSAKKGSLSPEFLESEYKDILTYIKVYKDYESSSSSSDDQ